jgi:hypothetical protein
MLGHELVLDRLIHADIEGLPGSLRVLQRNGDRLDQIADVDEVALQRRSVGGQSQRHRVIGNVTGHEIAPRRTAELIRAERKGIPEIVPIHDPRRPYTCRTDHTRFRTAPA